MKKFLVVVALALGFIVGAFVFPSSVLAATSVSGYTVSAGVAVSVTTDRVYVFLFDTDIDAGAEFSNPADQATSIPQASFSPPFDVADFCAFYGDGGHEVVAVDDYVQCNQTRSLCEGDTGAETTAFNCEGGVLFGLEVDPDPDPPVCGDTVIDAGEQCDDGGVEPGDGCDAACQIEAPPPDPGVIDGDSEQVIAILAVFGGYYGLGFGVLLVLGSIVYLGRLLIAFLRGQM